MTSSLATAMGLTWPTPTVNIPIGLGVNVHSDLIPTPFLKPAFDWVRYDLTGKDYSKTSLQAALSHYAKDFFIVWTVNDVVDLDAMYAAGIRQACCELINEGNLAISGHTALSPADITAKTQILSQRCRQYGYTPVGLGVNSWVGLDKIAWVMANIKHGILRYLQAVVSHAYDVTTLEQFRAIIRMQKAAFEEMSFFFTEYCLSTGAASQTDMDAIYPNLAPEVRRTHFVCDMAKIAMEERVAFCMYDGPSTDPDVQLLDNGHGWDKYVNAVPSQLYKDLMMLWFPDKYDGWLASLPKPVKVGS